MTSAVAQGKAKGLARTPLTLVGFTAFYTVSTYATTVFLARILGADSFGTYSFVFATIAVVGILATPGVDSICVRNVATHLVQEQPGLLYATVARAKRVTTLSSLALIAVCAPLSWLVYRGQQQLLLSLLAGILVMPVMASSRVNSAVIAGLGKVVQSRTVDLVLRPLLLGALLACYWALAPDMSPFGAVAVTGAAWLIAWAALGMLERRALAQTVPRPEEQPALDSWTASASAFLAFAIVSITAQQYLILITHFLSSARDVASTAVALRASSVIALGLIGVAATATPMAARLWAQRDAEGLRRSLLGLAAFSTLFALATTIVFVAFAGPLLGIFGPEYSRAITQFRILCGAQLIWATTGIASTTLLAVGAESRALIGNAIGLVVGLVATAVLIPRMGLVGAGVGYAMGIVVGQAVCIAYLWQTWQSLLTPAKHVTTT